MNTTSQPRQSLRTVQFVWAAISMSVVIYAFIAWLVAGKGGSSEGDPFANPLVIVLHVAGLGAIVAGLFLPRLMLASPDPSAPPLEPRAPGAPFEVSQRAMRAAIVGYALIESGAIFGLVLAFVTGAWWLVLPLGIASLSGLMLSFPSEDRVREPR